MPTKKKNKESGGKDIISAASDVNGENGDKKKPRDDKAGSANAPAKIAKAGGSNPPPPGAKAKTKGKEEDGGSNAAQFLREVGVEFRKITWPDRDTVLRETWGVLLLVAIITGLVLGFDWAVAHFIFQPLEHFARLHGGGIGQ